MANYWVPGNRAGITVVTEFATTGFGQTINHVFLKKKQAYEFGKGLRLSTWNTIIATILGLPTAYHTVLAGALTNYRTDVANKVCDTAFSCPDGGTDGVYIKIIKDKYATSYVVSKWVGHNYANLNLKTGEKVKNSTLACYI